MDVYKSRGLSFVLVGIVYILATVLGIAVAAVCDVDLWLKVFIGDGAATLFVFAFSVIFGNASIYDPYWSVQPIVIAVALTFTATVSAYTVLALIVICLWGVRLTANWAYTFKGLEHQDWRYTMLKEKTGKLYFLVNLIGIHFVPTLVVYACMMPVIFAFSFPPTLNACGVIFLAVSLLAVVLQCVADIQMHKFRKDKREGKVKDAFMRRGVWKHSRHPNYLAEIIMWWGVGLSFVCVQPLLWWLILGAFMNTLLFLAVSIPMADGKQSKKDGFEEYESHTRALIPIPKPLIKPDKK